MAAMGSNAGVRGSTILLFWPYTINKMNWISWCVHQIQTIRSLTGVLKVCQLKMDAYQVSSWLFLHLTCVPSEYPVGIHNLHSPVTVTFSPSNLYHLRPQMSPQSGVLGPSPCWGLPVLSKPERGARRSILGLGKGSVGLHRWAQLRDGHQLQPNDDEPWSRDRGRGAAQQRWQPRVQDSPEAQQRRHCQPHRPAKPSHHSADSALQTEWHLITQHRW